MTTCRFDRSWEGKTRVADIKKAAEFMGVPVDQAVQGRVNTVCHQIRLHESRLHELAQEYMDHEDEALALSALREMYAVHRAIKALISERSRLADRDKPQPVGRITDEMIDYAKNVYPIDQVVSFDKGGMAIAFCHNDKKASLARVRGANKARCWPCDKIYNPVDILMLRDGMSFVDAVKELSRGM